MVAVKFSPKNAPAIGKGRWTWPISLINDEHIIKRVIERGKQLEADIDESARMNVNWETSNPQLLWKTFKNNIRNIAMKLSKEKYYKPTSWAKKIEEELKKIRQSYSLDTDESTQSSEAFLADQLAHLEKLQARNK
jgi:hypothetical protein